MKDFEIRIPIKKKRYSSYPLETIHCSPPNWDKRGYEKELKGKKSINAVELDKYSFYYPNNKNKKIEAILNFYIWEKISGSWRIFINLEGIKKLEIESQTTKDKIYKTAVKIAILFLKEKGKRNDINRLIILDGFPKEEIIKKEMKKIPRKWDFKIDNDSTIISQ